MISNEKAVAKAYLTLVKLDAQDILDKLIFRRPVYLEVFALKRSRDHFADLFKSRYDSLSMKELSVFSPESLVALNKYYNSIDDIRWYLYHTQDMPNTVEEKLERWFIDLSKKLETLQLYIDAQLSVHSSED